MLCFALDKLKASFCKDLKPSFWALYLGRGVMNVIKNILNQHLPLNAHELVSGRLHIIVTRVRDCRSMVVSEFASREELIQVRAATATLRGQLQSQPL